MIAAPGGGGAIEHALPATDARRPTAVADALPVDPEPALAPVVAPLLARLLAGEPLDRDQRAVIVGEVMRLWELEARLATGPAERTRR